MKKRPKNGPKSWSYTVDGNQKSGDHQLRLVVYLPLFTEF